MSSIKPPPGMAECPFCVDGYDGQDEEGKWYACYACGTAGWMPAEAVSSYYRDCAWNAYVAAEQAILRRIALGVPAGVDYYVDEETGEAVLRRPRSAQPVAAVMSDEWEDIPF